jgi:2-keto-3-deoxy-6-phosphogluconate aldolase
MIKALSGPYAHTGVRFVPTGGASAASFAEDGDTIVLLFDSSKMERNSSRRTASR